MMDPVGGARDAPLGKISFIPMQFRGKNGQIIGWYIRPRKILYPPLEQSLNVTERNIYNSTACPIFLNINPI